MAVAKINYTNKRSGDLWTSNHVNEVKEVVNNNADELTTLQGSVQALQQQAYAAVANQTETTVAIDPNVLNIWNAAVSELAITFNAGSGGRPNEYMLQFTVSGSSFTLGLPSTVRWVEEPTWEAGSTYQVSILNNLAIYAGWEAQGQ